MAWKPVIDSQARKWIFLIFPNQIKNIELIKKNIDPVFSN